MTGEEARDLVAIVAAAWPRPPVSEATVYAYAFGLADLELEAAREAILRLIQTSRFLPTIAEIRERAVRGRVSLPSPEEAWGIVRRAMGCGGAHIVPAFDCDEIQAAVDAIGWRSICLDENESASRARFCAAMSSFTARRLDAEATGQYAPAERQLPAPLPPDIGCLAHKEPVLVRTGYATPRPAAPALAAGPAAAELGGGELGGKLLAGRFPSKRSAGGPP